MFQLISKRTIATAMLVTTSLLTFAPLAQADHGHGRWRRYKGERPVVRRVHASPNRHVIVRESNGAAPVIAGLIGGFILGTAVSHASDSHYRHAPVRSYRYYDPSCDESWDSLDECRLHFREHRRSARVIRVIEVSSGDCVRTLHYDGRDWQDEYDQDWDEDAGCRR